MPEKVLLTHTAVQNMIAVRSGKSLGKRGGSCACTYHIGMYGVQTA